MARKRMSSHSDLSRRSSSIIKTCRKNLSSPIVNSPIVHDASRIRVHERECRVDLDGVVLVGIGTATGGLEGVWVDAGPIAHAGTPQGGRRGTARAKQVFLRHVIIEGEAYSYTRQSSRAAGTIR